MLFFPKGRWSKLRGPLRWKAQALWPQWWGLSASDSETISSRDQYPGCTEDPAGQIQVVQSHLVITMDVIPLQNFLFHFCRVTSPAVKQLKHSSPPAAQRNRLRLRFDWKTANTPPLRPVETKTRAFPAETWRRNSPSSCFKLHNLSQDF